MRHPSSPTVNLSRADGDTVERAADRFAIAPAVLLQGANVGKGLIAGIRTRTQAASRSARDGDDCADPRCACRCCRALMGSGSEPREGSQT